MRVNWDERVRLMEWWERCQEMAAVIAQGRAPDFEDCQVFAGHQGSRSGEASLAPANGPGETSDSSRYKLPL
jgi:hypothetical protein